MDAAILIFDDGELIFAVPVREREEATERAKETSSA